MLCWKALQMKTFEFKPGPPDTLLVKLVFESEGARTAAAGDDRDLAFFLAELRARHAGIPEPDDADRFQIKESQ